MLSVFKKRKIMNYIENKNREDSGKKINLLVLKNELKLDRETVYKYIKRLEKNGKVKYYPPFKPDTVNSENAQDFVELISKPKKGFLTQSNKDAIKVAVIGGIVLYILQYLLKPILEHLLPYLGF